MTNSVNLRLDDPALRIHLASPPSTRECVLFYIRPSFHLPAIRIGPYTPVYMQTYDYRRNVNTRSAKGPERKHEHGSKCKYG